MLKSALKLLLIALVLLALLAVGAGAYLSNLNLNDHRHSIAETFSKATGLELRLSGIRHRIDYPWLELELNDVEIDSAEGFSERLLVSEHFKIRVALPPLLDKHVALGTVELRRARLHLIKNRQGRGNWQWPHPARDATGQQQLGQDESTGDPSPTEVQAESQTEASPDHSARGFTLSFREAKVEDLALSWRDEMSGKTVQIEDVRILGNRNAPGQQISVQAAASFSAAPPDLSGNFLLRGTLTPEERGGVMPLALEALLKSPILPEEHGAVALETTLRWQGGDAQLSDLKLQALGGAVSGQLQVRGADTRVPAINAQLNVRGQDIALPFKAAGIEPLASQLAKQTQRRYTVNAEFDADLEENTLNVETLDMSLLGAYIKANAQAKRPEGKGLVAQGSVQAGGPDLPLLLALAGAYLPTGNGLSDSADKLSALDKKRFAVSTRFDVDLKQGRVELPELRASALGMELTGRVSNAQNLQGQIDLVADPIKPVLDALGQQAMAETLQKLRLSVTLGGTPERVRLAPLTVRATLDGARLRAPTAAVALDAHGTVDIAQQHIEVEKLAISGLGLNLSGRFAVRDYSQQASYEGTLAAEPLDLRTLLKQIKYPPPPSADGQTLRHLALDKFSFSGDSNGLSVPNLRFQLDDSKVAGRFSITDFSAPRYELDLAVDQIDLDRYLPAQQAAETSGGAVAKPKDGTMQTKQLEALQFVGGLRVEDMTVAGLRLRSLKATMRAQDGLVHIDPLNALVYDGAYQGKASLDLRAAPPRLQLSSAAEHVQIEALLRDLLDTQEPYVSGIGNVNLKLASVGDNVAALLANLSGHGSLAMREGVFKSFDIAKTLYQIEQLIEAQRLGDVKVDGETVFNEMSATLNIDKGIVHNDDLLLQAPGFSAAGAGMLMNLNDATWQYTFSIATEEKQVEQGGERYRLGGHRLAVRCSGKIADKKCLPDVSALLAKVLGAAAAKLGEKASKRIQELLPGGAGKAVGDLIFGGNAAGGPVPKDGAETGEATPKDGAAQGRASQEDPEKPELKEELIDAVLDKLF